MIASSPGCIYTLKRLGSLPAWEWDYNIIVKMHSLQIMSFSLTRSLNLLAQKRHRQENGQRQRLHVTQQMIVMISRLAIEIF